MMFRRPCARAQSSLCPDFDKSFPFIVCLHNSINSMNDSTSRKSGPFIFDIKSFKVASGLSTSCTSPSIISPRLCGGMFVAIPTAMPDEPLTIKFGIREGELRVLRCFVKIWNKINGVLIYISEQFLCDCCKPCFCIPVGSSRISVTEPKLP